MHLAYMLEAYHDYFKELCETHTSLLHQDVDGERVFEMVDLSAAFGQLRANGKAASFFFRLQRPRLRYTRVNQQTYKVLDGGFVLARFGSVREQHDQIINEAQDQCLQIIDHFVARMVADSRNGHPLFEHSGETADALAFQAIPITHTFGGDHHGYACGFELSNEFTELSTCDPATWTDDGLTIY